MPDPVQSPDARAVDGRLEVGAVALPDGRTVLQHQYHSVPFHLSKPYWDGRVLLVQVVNPTAGIFDGDRMTSAVEAEKGAAVLVTSPSAARTHTRRAGVDAEDAFLHQSFKVAENAWLEVFPELLIPHSGSVYCQDTVVDVEHGGELYLVETLAPGRLAHGECLAYQRLQWSFSLRHGGRLVARERASVEPPDRCWMLEHPEWEQTFYAGIWMVSPALEECPEDLWETIEAEAGEHSRVGVSSVAEGVVAVKILADSSLVLRRLAARVRSLMTPHLSKLQSSPRKL